MNVDVSNEEILILLEDNSDEGREILIDMFKGTIDFYLNKYRKIFITVGIDKQDAYAEALFGFSDAINSFNDKKNAGFHTFLSICIERRLIKIIRKHNTLKSKFNSDVYSLDHVTTDGCTLIDNIKDDSADPLTLLESKESLNDIDLKVEALLSTFEYEVYLYMKEEYDYKYIANILDKDPKQVDNAIQRIKLKIKSILKD